MVHNSAGKYVELKVGHGDVIYLNGSDTGYKVGGDGRIYTKHGSFVSKDSVEDVMRSLGKIR
jgi:hypothetical protein